MWVLGVLGAFQGRAAPVTGGGNMGRGHGFLARSQQGQRTGPERAREARLQDIWAGGRCKIFIQEAVHGPKVSDGKLRSQGTGGLAGNKLGEGHSAAERSWLLPRRSDGDTEAETRLLGGSLGMDQLSGFQLSSPSLPDQSRPELTSVKF